MGASLRACALVCLLACPSAAEDDDADVPRESAELMAVLVPLAESEGRLVIDREAWEAWAKWYDSPEARRSRAARANDAPPDEVTDEMLREQEPEDDPVPMRIYACWHDVALSAFGGGGCGGGGSEYYAFDTSEAASASLLVDTAQNTFSLHVDERGGSMRSLDVVDDPRAGLEIRFEECAARASLILRAWSDGRVAVVASRGEEEVAAEAQTLEDLARAEPDKVARLVAVPLAEIGIRIPGLPRVDAAPRGLGASREVASQWLMRALHLEDGSVATIDVEKGSTGSIGFTPDGSSLLIDGPRDEIQVWATEDWTRTRVLRGAGRAFVIGPDGRSLAAWGGGALRLLDLETGVCRVSIRNPDGPAVFSDGGRVVVAWVRDAASGACLQGFDAETGKELWASQAFSSWECDMAPDRATASVALGCRMGKEERVFILDARTGKVAHEWRPVPSIVRGIAWSADGAALLTLGAFEGVVARDPVDGRVVRVLAGGRGHRLVPSPDGSRLALIGDMIQVLDATTGSILTAIAPPVWIKSVAWSRDGGLLSASTEAGVVKVWRVPE